MGIMRQRGGWLRMAVVAMLAGGLLLTAGEVPARAATTLHVTTCNGDAATAGSLPNLVMTAESGDTIVFDLDCPSTSPITLSDALGLWVSNLTIDGTGHSIAVDGGCTISCDTPQTANGVRMVNVSSLRSLRLIALTIQHSHTPTSGGAIVNEGTMWITGCTIVDNGASVVGGAIMNDGGTMWVTNSTIVHNTAAGGSGGGIYNTGSLTLIGSTLTNNHVSYSGDDGGRVWMDSGGSIYSEGFVSATGSIIVGNIAPHGPDVAATVTSGGHNLIGKTDDSSGWLASDLTGTIAAPLNAHLAPLASNGGPTQTMALQANSPAIGAGNPTVYRVTGPGNINGVDQRGMPRLASVCDIGAYQMQGATLAASLTGGTSGVAGTTLPLVVSARDGYGIHLDAFTGTVHFTSTDPQAILPADYIFTGAGSGKDDGTHHFTVTFRTAGMQIVTVTDTLSNTLTAQATAIITPTVTSVSPASGGTVGGNRVTLIGLGFGTLPASLAVTIGGAPAAVVSVTDTQLVVTAPAHTGVGAVNVVVTVNGQSVTVANAYTYGTVTPLPSGPPSGPTKGGAAPVPGARPSAAGVGSVPGSPNPLPPSR